MAVLKYNIICTGCNNHPQLTSQGGIVLNAKLLTWAFVSFAMQGNSRKKRPNIIQKYDLGGLNVKLRSPISRYDLYNISRINMQIIFSKIFKISQTCCQSHQQYFNCKSRKFYYDINQTVFCLPAFSVQYYKRLAIDRKQFNILAQILTNLGQINPSPYSITTFFNKNSKDVFVDIYDPPLEGSKENVVSLEKGICNSMSYCKNILKKIECSNNVMTREYNGKQYVLFREDDIYIGLDEKLIRILENNSLDEFKSYGCEEVDIDDFYVGLNGICVVVKENIDKQLPSI